jgi:hypothetical protein
MKNFLLLTCLALAAAPAFASPGFSWFHTRPKPVLLEEDSTSARKPAVTRAVYHPAPAPAQSTADKSPVAPQSHMTTVMTHKPQPAAPAKQ